MKVRRIVTGHDSSGRAIFASDETAPRSVQFEHVPGLGAALLWQTAMAPSVGGTSVDPTPRVASWLPEGGGTSAMVLVFPPDSIAQNPNFDPRAAGAEYAEKLPGLAEKFEADAPGMHRTDTLDYAILLDGEICLELDDGAFRTLNRYDVVVQNGTRHAWRNRGSKPATMLFVMVSAARVG